MWFVASSRNLVNTMPTLIEYIGIGILLIPLRWRTEREQSLLSVWSWRLQTDHVVLWGVARWRTQVSFCSCCFAFELKLNRNNMCISFHLKKLNLESINNVKHFECRLTNLLIVIEWSWRSNVTRFWGADCFYGIYLPRFTTFAFPCPADANWSRSLVLVLCGRGSSTSSFNGRLESYFYSTQLLLLTKYQPTYPRRILWNKDKYNAIGSQNTCGSASSSYVNVRLPRSLASLATLSDGRVGTQTELNVL